MKFSETWLREWVNPPIDTAELAQQLTMSGLEVDSVKRVAIDFEKVVVAEVVAAEKHPDADRLKVCSVNVGSGEPLSIVCGGKNVRAGLKVALIMVGGRLGPDFKVKKSKLRGVVSQGMICSERELGLSEEDTGFIMELPADAPVGVDLRDYLSLDDNVIDIELTANRGDCASVCGIAREVAAANNMSFSEMSFTSPPVTIDDTLPVTISSPACGRYVGRVVRDINQNALTPVWMQERLRRSGLRPIHPVVDAANYVMLEWGQPLHAFDLNKLKGDIQVRNANAGEKIMTIDGNVLSLEKTDLVIADEKQAQALAGILGGAESAVDDNTQHIFIESAYFVPSSIALSARRLGLQTDSSYRFERGVDWQLQVKAIERVTELVLAICGGKAGPVCEAIEEGVLPETKTILLRRDRILRLLGVKLSADAVEMMLAALGMQVTPDAVGWQVTVPSHRFDITQEVDLVEEVARLYGYHKIPEVPLDAVSHIPNLPESEVSLERLRDQLLGRGYHEAVTYSFVSDQTQRLLFPTTGAIALSNPMSSDMNVMRVSLWPGLLSALEYNLRRQASRVRLFEIGTCFVPTKADWRQHKMVGGLIAGQAHTLQWGEAKRQADFYDVKGDLQALLDTTGRAKAFRFVSEEHSALHPGQSAAIYLDDRRVGYIGALHPQLLSKFSPDWTPYLFEVELDALTTARMPQYQPISKFPAIRRDLAVVVAISVEAAEIEQCIAESCGHLLNNVQIFDIYSGKGVELGKKSVALGLTFQDPSRTLIDEEVNQVIERVINNLEKTFSAKLRA